MNCSKSAPYLAKLHTEDEINLDDINEEYSFSYFINKVWNYHEHLDSYGEYKRYIEKLDKKYHNEGYKGYTFITIAPDKFSNRNIEYTEENFIQMIKFCKAQFSEYTYDYYYWVIESGKDENAPHLHIHALIKLKKGKSKHHKRNLECLWKKFFKHGFYTEKNGSRDYDSHNLNTKECYDKKVNYMINDRKGTHMNFEDLSNRGGVGFSESLVSI